MVAATMRLGDILVAQGSINRDYLESFLTQLQGRLGQALRAHSAIHGRALAQALATQQGITYLELQGDSFIVPAPLFTSAHVMQYVQRQYLPYRDEGGTLYCLTPDPTPELSAWLSQFYQRRVALCVVSARDFTHAISRNAARHITRQATLGLRARYKHLVADRVLLRPQWRRMGIFSAALLVVLAAAPHTTWYTLVLAANMFYVATLAFRLKLFYSGHAENLAQLHLPQQLDNAAAAMPLAQLPIYTVLVPLYQENNTTLQRLISHLTALDYPKEKLDIKLICEADDQQTIGLLKQLQPPETMEILEVPASYPRTKPKACNVALSYIRGEYLVIYDAEDAPEPNQLKRAVAMFAREPREVACLQASLTYYNREENLLTRLFSIEYSSLFRLHLPALKRLHLPIPLSGTSNHIRVAMLQHIGGWDAFNVTEDADLGVRLSYFGYRTKLLPSFTYEESPITLGAWMRQRSRWIKGFMQTWLVYMRDPYETKRRLGTRGYVGFQFFIGAPVLTFLIAPFFWLLLPLNLALSAQTQLPSWLLIICGLSFLAGIVLQLLYAISVVGQEKWQRMGWAIALYPFYWLLHSVASVRALWQLTRTPHQWEKTQHGVTRILQSA